MNALVEIKSRLEKVHDRIEKALISSGREGDSVRLIAVSKTFPAEYLSAAIGYGVTDLGESKVQESASKKPLVEGQARWHLIGHLQSNKVKKALQIYDLIQSVDSFKLAQEISRRAEHEIEILVQVNSSGEESKFGFSLDEAPEQVLEIAQLENVKVMGLMTIGRHAEDEIEIQKSFSDVRKIFEDLKRFENNKLSMTHLSMGMSGDFELALAQGATMLRIGSNIFGPRG